MQCSVALSGRFRGGGGLPLESVMSTRGAEARARELEGVVGLHMGTVILTSTRGLTVTPFDVNMGRDCNRWCWPIYQN